MSYNLHVSSYFAKEAKRLSKKYPSFKHDLDKFKKSLQETPLQGPELSPGIRKIRMAIESKHKGLSGGARVITYNVLAQEQNGEIELLLLYDKGDAETVKLSVVKEIIRDMGVSLYNESLKILHRAIYRCTCKKNDC